MRRVSRWAAVVAAVPVAACACAWLLATGAGPALADTAAPPAATRGAPLPVKVLFINLFGLEAAPWISALKPDLELRVPGLSSDYPLVRCNSSQVCEVATGMGHANAAASVMAVLLSGQFDLHSTYFVVAGIDGMDPEQGTLGSVAWARYVVDAGIAHEIDAREIPPGWKEGYFGVLTHSPDEMPKLEYRSEVFQLDEALLQRALSLSTTAALEDSEDMRAYRAHYAQTAARQPPRVTQCDTLSGDTWWAGRLLGDHARHWMRLLTAGKGVYCTTQQEDNAVLEALTRGSQAGLLDLRRVVVLRSASDFDRPYAGQSALQSLETQLALPNAFRIATLNLVHAGMPLIDDIVQHWDAWQQGVPGGKIQP